MLALVVFLLAVYGLASALAVLKFGQYFFGIGYCKKKDCPVADCSCDEILKKEGHPKEHRKFLGRIPFFGDIFYCPPCISFYIGMAFSAFILSPSRALVPIWWKAMIMDGLAAVAFSYFVHVLVEKLSHGLDV